MTEREWQLEVAEHLGRLAANAEEAERGHARLREDMNSGFARLADALRGHTDSERAARDALAKRVVALELWRSWCVGIAAGVAGLVSAVKALAAWRG